MKSGRVLLLLVLLGVGAGCRQVAVEYRVDKKTHLGTRVGTLDERADHALYVLNGHKFEYDMRPVGDALVHNGSQTAQTLPPGESLFTFISIKPGPSSAAAHKTRFGGSVALPKKPLTLDELKINKASKSVLTFQEINSRRWAVVSAYKDSAHKMVQAEEWASVIDGFVVTFWMHVDDLAPMDAKLRKIEAERLRAIVRRFHYAP